MLRLLSLLINLLWGTDVSARRTPVTWSLDPLSDDLTTLSARVMVAARALTTTPPMITATTNLANLAANQVAANLLGVNRATAHPDRRRPRPHDPQRVVATTLDMTTAILATITAPVPRTAAAAPTQEVVDVVQAAAAAPAREAVAAAVQVVAVAAPLVVAAAAQAEAAAREATTVATTAAMMSNE